MKLKDVLATAQTIKDEQPHIKNPYYAAEQAVEALTLDERLELMAERPQLWADKTDSTSAGQAVIFALANHIGDQLKRRWDREARNARKANTP